MISLQSVETSCVRVSRLRVESLQFERGSITAVAGRNRSGKSTLLRTVAGLLPYTGQISVDGREVRRLTNRDRALRIAWLPQSLPPVRIRVSALTAYGRYARTTRTRPAGAADCAAVERAMKLADVTRLADRMVDTLSGGERARAYLAMVIAQETDYLLLDEPASDMDVPHQQLLGEVLKQLAREGQGIVVSSHDLPWAFSVSRVICLLDGGQAAASGTPDMLAQRADLLEQIIGVPLVPAANHAALYRFALGRPSQREAEQKAGEVKFQDIQSLCNF